jgi:hypothetical protein
MVLRQDMAHAMDAKKARTAGIGWYRGKEVEQAEGCCTWVCAEKPDQRTMQG